MAVEISLVRKNIIVRDNFVPTLSDICELIIDCEHKTAPVQDTGYPSIRTVNIGQGRLILDGVNKVSEETYQEWTERAVPQPGDLILAREAPIGNVAIIPENLWVCLGQRTVLIRPDRSRIEPLYLMYRLLSEDIQWKFYIESLGATVSHLNMRDIRGLELPKIPRLAEQRAIAAILSAWDEAITLTERLITALQARKRGLMQRLLTGEVRFAEFEGEEWETRRFGDVFERVTRKNNEGNDNVLTASAQHGLVSQTDFFNKSVAGKSLEGYYLIRKGEFAYNRSYSTGYPMGAIKRLDDYGAGVLSTLYICFRLISELDNPDFFVYFFESGGLNRGIYTIAQEGARNHGLLNVGLSDFFDLPIAIPGSDEQNRIADVLNTHEAVLDGVITQRDTLVEQKKGLMQRLLTGEVRVEVNEH